MEREAIGFGSGIVGILTVAAGIFLGCKAKFIFAAIEAHQFISLFVEGIETKIVYICLVAAVVLCSNSFICMVGAFAGKNYIGTACLACCF